MRSTGRMTGFYAAGVSSGRPEPLTAAPELLLAELRELQRTHRVATHEVLDGRRV